MQVNLIGKEKPLLTSYGEQTNSSRELCTFNKEKKKYQGTFDTKTHLLI